jgi:hypothetical protein
VSRGELFTFFPSCLPEHLPAAAALLETATSPKTKTNTPSGRPDHLQFAWYEHPFKVRLIFADGHSWIRSFQQLELDMSNMKPETIKASEAGTAMLAKSKRNEWVEIDASALRATVDPAYKAKLDEAFVALRGPLENLIVTAPKKREIA